MSRSTIKDPAKSKSSETFFKVLRFIGRYRFLLIFSIILAAVSVILQLYVPILFGNAIDQVIAQHQVNFEMMWYYLSRILVMVILSSAATWLMNVINNRMTYQTVKDIRAKAIRHIQVLPLSYLDGHSTGDIISRIIADTDILSDGMLLGFTQLFTGVITILGTIVFMLSINPLITLVVVVLSPMSFFIANFISKKTFIMFKKQSEARGELTGLTNEMLEGIKVVQAFGHEEETQKQFKEINERLANYSLRATFFSSITNPATRFMYACIYAGVAISACFGVINGILSVGQLSSFLSYTNQYTKPFNEITSVITEFQNSLASAARVFELIDEKPISDDKADSAVLDSPKGEISLEQVDFSYTPEVPLIQGLNLHANPGQRIAIVGPTGCGKTTLINLLMRFYEINGGSIKIDGHDIDSITRHSLRASYGMVLQETWLKSASIWENISYGNPDATKEEIIQAAKEAHAHSFIMRMPDGYDTILSEGGSNLSQGQRQLLCIARVMLCLPPMLILDEATSSIDTMTEIRIQKAFEKMMHGRTSFIVAHRLSTIKNADIILVMKDGHIIEQGSHKELLSKNGFYATLYNSQFAPV